MDTNSNKPIIKRHLKQPGKLNRIWVLGDTGIRANFVGVKILLWFFANNICTYTYISKIICGICFKILQERKQSKCVWSGKDEIRTRVLNLSDGWYKGVITPSMFLQVWKSPR